MKELDYCPAKQKQEFRSNYKLHDLSERATIKSYEHWKRKLSMSVMIAFLIFDYENKLMDRRCAFLGKHSYSLCEEK